MKILPVEKIKEADAFTIANEPVASIDLMERAATICYQWILKKVRKDHKVIIFCGLGNNGGDGLVIARLLALSGYSVEVIIVRHSDKASDDFMLNYERIQDIPAISVRDIHEDDPLPQITEADVVIDAILGSGLSKPVEGFAAKLIHYINSSKAIVIAIDIPSGLFGDTHSDEKAGAIIKADYTLTFQFPKVAFMFAENERYTGDWTVLPIGLHPDFINKVEAKDYLVTAESLKGQLRPRLKFAHKGHFGHALLIAGSYGKMGASVLASMACLRSGVGLLHTHTPKKGYSIIQTAVPEAMVSIDQHEEFFSGVPDLSPYTAVGIGPGIGFDKQTRNALKLLIQNASVPLVFDADAITILAENKTWIPFVPKNSVFTPHPGEFERLVGKAKDDFHRNKLQREFAIKYGVYVVLKGAHTSVCGPDGICYFNTTGNPGMATGGSGDVLAGLILGLIAQKYPPVTACVIAVYIHGLAGDFAAEKYGYEALTAGSIIEKIGKAFKVLHKIDQG